ncbi:MAG: hypothetical protein ACOCRK_04765, partial [bacterium]
ILTKEDVRKNFNQLVENSVMKYYYTASTSGITGKPLKIKRDLYSIYYENANFYRILNWAGYKKGDRIAVIRGDKFKNDFYYYNKLNNRLYISSFDLSNNLRKTYDLLKDFNITYIFAYPSSINMICSYIIANDLEEIVLKGIITSSEMVTKLMRKRAKIAFKSIIYDYYGQAERVSMIQNCEEEEYHLMVDYGAENFRHIENDKYEVVSTNLFNYAMPFINYSTGDIVLLNKKKSMCSKKYPVIEKILGRKSDYVINNGNKVYSPTLTHVFYDMKDNNIIQSQFIQNNEEEITLNIIIENKNEKGTLDELRNSLQKYMGDNNITINVCSSLIIKKNGKTPFIINNIK